MWTFEGLIAMDSGKPTGEGIDLNLERGVEGVQGQTKCTAGRRDI
jgi:hypothetical protein